MTFMMWIVRLVEPFEMALFGGSHWAGWQHVARQKHAFAHMAEHFDFSMKRITGKDITK